MPDSRLKYHAHRRTDRKDARADAEAAVAVQMGVAAADIYDYQSQPRLRSDPATGKARIITDTVSDNAANAGVVLGPQRHTLDSHDLRRVGAIVKRDGVVEAWLREEIPRRLDAYDRDPSTGRTIEQVRATLADQLAKRR